MMLYTCVNVDRLLKKKSILIPTQRITFLGFIIDSVNMTISLSSKKKEKIQTLCRALQTAQTTTIRDVASAIGSIVAVFPAVAHGPLFYRQIEISKKQSTTKAKGKF